MSIIQEGHCPFCKQPAKYWHVGSNRNFYGFDCHICKSFFISDNVVENLKSLTPEKSQGLLNCISENIKSNAPYGKEIITSWHLRAENISSFPLAKNITVKYFDDFMALKIDHASKPDQILLRLGEKASTGYPFDEVFLELADIYLLKISGIYEYIEWARQLFYKKLIESQFLDQYIEADKYTNNHLKNFKIKITPLGWQSISDQHSTSGSKKVFIAMKFNWLNAEDKRVQYLEAIKAGCFECGYEADVVSQEHTDQITDRIVAEIKASKFVIADFTYNNQGVYYEAGLARGFGKKVIHTVMEGHTADTTDEFKKLHFDIRQINYLEWSDPTLLKDKIKNRIKAVIEDQF